MKNEEAINEAIGVAAAAYGLSSLLLRMLHEQGVLPKDRVAELLRQMLLKLETHGDPKSAHASRALLVGLAEEFGVELRKPN